MKDKMSSDILSFSEEADLSAVALGGNVCTQKDDAQPARRAEVPLISCVQSNRRAFWKKIYK